MMKIKQPKYNKAIQDIAIVHSFDKTPMSKVTTRLVDIKGKWYFDIRIYDTFINKTTNEEITRRKKGICLSIEFISEIRDAVAAVQNYIDMSVEE